MNNEQLTKEQEDWLNKMDTAATLRDGKGANLQRCSPTESIHVFQMSTPQDYTALRCQCGGVIASAIWIASPGFPNPPSFLGGWEIPD